MTLLFVIWVATSLMPHCSSETSPDDPFDATGDRPQDRRNLTLGNARMLERNDVEHPIPPEWRIVFHDIADAFVAGDFALQAHVLDRVSPIGLSTAKFIADSISAYGDPIAPLQPAVWDRAVYRWMDGYWQFLVDLTTEGEDVSDLTLHAKLLDAGNARIEVQSVHVR